MGLITALLLLVLLLILVLLLVLLLTITRDIQLNRSLFLQVPQGEEEEDSATGQTSHGSHPSPDGVCSHLSTRNNSSSSNNNSSSSSSSNNNNNNSSSSSSSRGRGHLWTSQPTVPHKGNKGSKSSSIKRPPRVSRS